MVNTMNMVPEAGIQPVYLSGGAQSQAETFLKCYAVEKGYSLKSQQWLERFNVGQAVASEGGLEEVFSLLNQYVAGGAVTPGEVGLTVRDKQYQAARREVAMVGGDATLLRGISNASGTDEFRLMPFFSADDGKGYFFVYPMLNLAVGKQVEEDPEKEQVIDEILGSSVASCPKWKLRN